MKPMSLSNSLNGNMGSKRVPVCDPDSSTGECAVDRIKLRKQPKPVRFEQPIACFLTPLRRDSIFKKSNRNLRFVKNYADCCKIRFLVILGLIQIVKQINFMVTLSCTAKLTSLNCCMRFLSKYLSVSFLVILYTK